MAGPQRHASPASPAAAAPHAGGHPRLERQSLEKVAGVFRVFAEATRLEILQELKHGARNVSALVAALGVSQANVSKQLRTLHEAGVIHRRRQGTQAIYTICDPLTFELCNLVCQKLNREAAAPHPLYKL